MFQADITTQIFLIKARRTQGFKAVFSICSPLVLIQTQNKAVQHWTNMQNRFLSRPDGFSLQSRLPLCHHTHTVPLSCHLEQACCRSLNELVQLPPNCSPMLGLHQECDRHVLPSAKLFLLSLANYYADLVCLMTSCFDECSYQLVHMLNISLLFGNIHCPFKVTDAFKVRRMKEDPEICHTKIKTP